MANIRKQFNFRNGVQVDDDNLVVSPTGLVGIGTTIPTEYLDVRGTAKVVGLVTANQIFTPSLNAINASITNLTLSDSIIGSGVSIRSGIITATGTGVVTYYGDGGRLLNLPTSQWLDVDVGLGFTSIYAQGYVGIGTNDPRFLFQISGNTDKTVVGFTSGVGFSSEGNILATGIITAYKFAGIGSDLKGLNASNIDYGTLSNDRIPVLLNSKLPANINVSGIITATGGFIGTVGGTLYGNVIGNLTGDVTGTASTARSLTGNPDILVNNITATSIAVTSINASSIACTTVSATGNVSSLSGFNVGFGGTTISLTSNGRIGIGSAIPTQSIQIIGNGGSAIEVIGNESRLILGQEKSGVSVATSAGVIRYGNSNNNFELLNYAQGNFNFYLHSGNNTGIDTGRFGWVYGQTFNELMTLTYGGNLGIGKTNPENTLHVVGTSTVTGNSWIGGDLSISGTLSAGTIQLPSTLNDTNIYTLSGVSTFNNLNVQNITQLASIGIGTTSPITNIDARTTTALFAQVGLGSTNPRSTLDVNGQALIGSVGIGTTTTGGDGLVISDKSAVLSNNAVLTYSTSLIMDGGSSIGIGTTLPRTTLDFSDAGKNILGGAYRYMLPPRITTAERTGLSTVAGAFIFNTTTSKFQGYTGIAWTDFH